MNDLRFAFRQLLKCPGVSAVAILTLALGIGANTAIFTLVDHVMLRMLPVPNPQELVIVPGQFSYPRYQRLRELNQVFSETFATHALLEMAISIPGETEGQVKGELVSGTYFTTLGVGAMLGRTILPEDDRAPESSPVAVISHGFWQRAFGGAQDVLGKKISVRSRAGNASTSGLNIYDGASRPSADSAVLTIVGVMAPGFFGDTVGTSLEVWIPMMMQAAVLPGRPWLDKPNVSWLTVMGRLRPGVTEKQARPALNVLWRRILTEEAGDALTPERQRSIAQEVLNVESGGKGFQQLRNQFSQSLQILTTVVGLVLLIACLNLASLLMARGTARAREFAVRLALGAGRGGLVRQLLVENLLLGTLGGALGLVFAFVGVRILVALASSGYQAIDLPLRPDWRSLAFTAAISLLTTILFGLAPAFRATRVRVAESLKATARSTAARQRSGGGKTLVAVQVAVSMVLLIGAGLFLRTFHNLRTQDVGYDPDRLLMMSLDPVSAGYRGDDIGRLCHNLLERIRALPGVRDATFSENGLFYGPESGTKVDVEGFTPRSEEERRARFDQVGPHYFTSIGIPLLLGRDFTDRDGPGAPRVTVINESMAKFYFPSNNPIGKRLETRIGKDRFQLEIVGVARDAQDHSFWWEPLRRFYVSYAQPIDGITAANFEIRTLGNPGALGMLLRREVQAVDRSLMILGLRDLPALMDQSLMQTRLLTSLSSFFGLCAIVLAAIGLYGVMAHDVVQRTSEIGIRMALGAQRPQVLRLVVGQGMKLVGIGTVVGGLGALASTNWLSSWLYQIKPTDPSTLLAVALLVFAVALFACWLPARRASKLEPMGALRYE